MHRVARAVQAQCHSWAPPLHRALGTSATSRAYDVVIIGGGVVGCACALELSRKGHKTLNVDMLPSPGYGSTSSSSSIVRLFYSALDSCKLSWEAYHGWENWAEYLEAPASEELCTFRTTGGLVLDAPASPECQTFLRRVQASFDTLGIPCERWDGAELRERLPYLATQSYYPPRRVDDDRFGEENGTQIEGGLFTKYAGYVSDPQLAARNLMDAAMRHGAVFRGGSHVTQIQHNGAGDRVTAVVLEDGSVIESPIIINAAGPHSGAIHKLAFRDASVVDDSKVSSRPMRVEVAYVPGPQGVDSDSSMPFMFDLDVGVYMRPQQGGMLVAGSVEPECDQLEFLHSADEKWSESLTDEWTNFVYRAALRLPDLRIPSSATGLAALYDVTPDWTPLYDRTALVGFYSMRGTSGNQFKNVPVVGKILANLVEHCETGNDHDATPMQLPLEWTSQTLNSGSFSRLRSGAETTGSVIG